MSDTPETDALHLEQGLTHAEYRKHAGGRMQTMDTEKAMSNLPRDPYALKCLWSEDEDGTWDTECGEAWQFTDGTPYENRMEFCPFCGNRLTEKRHEPEPIEE